MQDNAKEKQTSGKPLITHNEFDGFLKKCLLEDAERLGQKPGKIIKMIVHRYYKRKAA